MALTDQERNEFIQMLQAGEHIPRNGGKDVHRWAAVRTDGKEYPLEYARKMKPQGAKSMQAKKPFLATSIVLQCLLGGSKFP